MLKVNFVFSMGDPLAYLLKSFVALMDHDVMSWNDLEPKFIKQVSIACNKKAYVAANMRK